MTERKYTVKSSDTHWGGLTASAAARELEKLSIYGIEACIFDGHGRLIRSNISMLYPEKVSPHDYIVAAADS